MTDGWVSIDDVWAVQERDVEREMSRYVDGRMSDEPRKHKPHGQVTCNDLARMSLEEVQRYLNGEW
jgi:hypothetical protein